MGDFSSSCAVSNLPISGGDDVLWIYAKKKYINSTHDLSNTVWRHMEKLEEIKKFEQENKEFAKRFPKGDSLWGEFWTTTECDFEWGFGKYDEYGWVEDEKLPDKYMDSKILVRKDVADKLAVFGKTLISREWYNSKPYLVDSYLYCFLLVCQLTRIHLFGHQLLGRQYPDSDEMKEQNFVHKVIGDELKKLTNSIRIQELEYKDWSFWVGIESKIRNLLKKIKYKKGEHINE